jgi:hypothetical protein
MWRLRVPSVFLDVDDNLDAFQFCLQLAQWSQFPPVDHVRSIGPLPPGLEEKHFAETVQRWNGDFLWAPASASIDPISRFGDEARSVFGNIPEGDCSDGVARTLPLQIDGNLVDLKPNLAKEGHPLEFEHRDAAGNRVRWTSGVAQCDKPSLAGSAAFCGLNSRLSRVERGNVEWLFFCRKSSPSGEIEPTPYWQRSNPNFALLGVIGFNRSTGETTFLDGRKAPGEFDWSRTFVPPGGHSYSDRRGRAEAEALYDPTFHVECSACHDNKSPYVITPSIQQARVGFAGNGQESAADSGLGNYLPAMRRDRAAPFRVVGSAYTATHRVSLERAMTVRDPTGNCTECHTLTTQVTGQRFAADAVAKAPTINQPSRSQFLRLKAEQRKLREINTHRTAWATRQGTGKIHPWMIPVDGNDLSAHAPEISSSDWDVLSNCLWGAGGPECDYRPLYTGCPPPGVAEDGDVSEPVDFSVRVLPAGPEERHADRVLRLSWRYLNTYGGVAQRDDVRFNVAVRFADIPVSGAAPAGEDYPEVQEAEDRGFVAIAGETGRDAAALLIRNVSYLGHLQFTEPAPATVLRSFQLDVPAMCNRRYLFRVLPKRFCFDQTGFAYGRQDHLLFADVSCN